MYMNHGATHMDVFMALFMLCAIEVVVLKVLTFEEEQEQSRMAESGSGRHDS
jgi:hypothetical protein